MAKNNKQNLGALLEGANEEYLQRMRQHSAKSIAEDIAEGGRNPRSILDIIKALRGQELPPLPGTKSRDEIIRENMKRNFSPRLKKGGNIKGPSHADGGKLIEVEGGEYIIKKDSVNGETEPFLEYINVHGKLPPSIDAKKRRK